MCMTGAPVVSLLMRNASIGTTYTCPSSSNLAGASRNGRFAAGTPGGKMSASVPIAAYMATSGRVPISRRTAPGGTASLADDKNTKETLGLSEGAIRSRAVFNIHAHSHAATLESGTRASVVAAGQNFDTAPAERSDENVLPLTIRSWQNGKAIVFFLCVSTLRENTELGTIKMADAVVRLNVGGQIFETTYRTLTEPVNNSMLATLASERWASDTEHFIDRSPELFKHVLECMRRGCRGNARFEEIAKSYATNNVPSDMRNAFLEELDYFLLAPWRQSPNCFISETSNVKAGSIRLGTLHATPQLAVAALTALDIAFCDHARMAVVDMHHRLLVFREDAEKGQYVLHLSMAPNLTLTSEPFAERPLHEPLLFLRASHPRRPWLAIEQYDTAAHTRWLGVFSTVRRKWLWTHALANDRAVGAAAFYGSYLVFAPIGPCRTALVARVGATGGSCVALEMRSGVLPVVLIPDVETVVVIGTLSTPTLSVHVLRRDHVTGVMRAVYYLEIPYLEMLSGAINFHGIGGVESIIKLSDFPPALAAFTTDHSLACVELAVTASEVSVCSTGVVTLPWRVYPPGDTDGAHGTPCAVSTEHNDTASANAVSWIPAYPGTAAASAPHERMAAWAAAFQTSLHDFVWQPPRPMAILGVGVGRIAYMDLADTVGTASQWPFLWEPLGAARLNAKIAVY